MKKEYTILVSAALAIAAIVFLGNFITPDGYTNNQSAKHAHSQMEINSEQTFLEHMIPHHAEAVISSEAVLAQTNLTESVRVLAEAIAYGQSQELEEMTQWYEDWYGEGSADNENYQPMMSSLEGLSGGESERVFLTDMIAHHEAAVIAAEEVLLLEPRPEVIQLAQAVIETQQFEVGLMSQILASLRKVN